MVVLFGYDTSAFTQKARYILRLKQIPYTFITVPTMMPRPVLKDYFNIGYRKIPVVAINKDVYLDTSVIIEALEHQFPSSEGYGTVYPVSADGRLHRSMMRGFASYWTDRPFFRAVCGFMPAALWRSQFGKDRASLIGHKLDPDKLERKIPQHLSQFDLQLSLLEPQFQEASEELPWIFSTKAPSLADIALFHMLEWSEKMSRGEGLHHLTGGDAEEGLGEGCSAVFNSDRYPGAWRWFYNLRKYLNQLPLLETKVDGNDTAKVDNALSTLAKIPLDPQIPMVPTTASSHREMDERIGLAAGVDIAIAPDDTGMNDPTFGRILALGPEELVISPAPTEDNSPKVGDLRLHFPRIHFRIRTDQAPSDAKQVSAKL